LLLAILSCLTTSSNAGFTAGICKRWMWDGIN
jgi:hypothetical protein